MLPCLLCLLCLSAAPDACQPAAADAALLRLLRLLRCELSIHDAPRGIAVEVQGVVGGAARPA